MATGAFGKYLKELRIKRGLTLREHCQRNGFDPGNYSRMERGLFPPPQRHELLEKYARALDVVEGSDEWMELFDLAAATRGEIPKDLLEDDEVVQKLPVLFRTLRAESVSEHRLDDLIEKVRRS
jgi:transcriptional regulator with XRE-family HTH domain